MSPDSRTADVTCPTDAGLKSPLRTGISAIAAHKLFSMIARAAVSDPSLALLDQCIASGSRFLVIILVGRMAGPASLGVYGLAIAVLIAMAIVQEALVIRPYTVYSNQMQQTRRRAYSGSVLAQLLLLSSVGGVLSLALSMIVLAIDQDLEILWKTAAALSIAIPGVLVWEFARRFAFSRMNMLGAIAIDGSLAFLQLASLALLIVLRGGLSEYSALLAVGVSSLVVGAIALGAQRNEFLFVASRFWSDAQKNWHFGKWVCSGQLVGLLQVHAVPYLLAVKLGTSATGMLTACQTILALSNPFLLGIANWLGPHSARAFSEGGVAQVAHLTRRCEAWLVASMVLFWCVMMMKGDSIVTALLGSQYSGQGAIMALLGPSAIGLALTIGATSGLAALHRTRLITLGMLIGAIVTLLGTWPLVSIWGIKGAAMILGLGSISAGIAHMWGFEQVSHYGDYRRSESICVDDLSNGE